MQLEAEYDRARTRTELTKCLVGTALSIVLQMDQRDAPVLRGTALTPLLVQRASMYSLHLNSFDCNICRIMYLNLLSCDNEYFSNLIKSL